MEHYSNYGHKEFFIALGYKGHIIKNYFKTKSFQNGRSTCRNRKNTMTGGRLKKFEKIIKNETYAYLWRWTFKC